MARFRQGDAVSALATTEAILKEQPENLDALLLAGQIHHARKEHPAASKLLGKALELAPGQPGLMANLAAVCLALGDVQRSETLARRAARIVPDHFGARYNHGLALMAQRRYHAATRTLKKGRYHSSYLIGLQYQAHTSFSLARDRTRLNELRVSLRSRMEQAFDPSEFADQLLSRFTVLAGNNTS